MKRKKLWLLPVILAAAVILVLALRGFPGGKGTDPAAAPSEQDGSAALTGPEETELPLDDIQLEILRSLLAGKPVSGLIREHHLMPALTADMINEAMYDEIGDSIVDCDNDNLSLVEDYREDLTQLLGGDRS